MEVAVVVIGIVALMAVSLSVFLLWKLLSNQSRSQGADSAFGHQVGELRQDMDKVDASIQQLGKEQSSQSVELIESQNPIQILRYELIPDRAGAGKYRGGVPYRRDYLFTEEEAVLQVRSDRRRFRPYGLYGGYAGRPSRNILNPDKEARLLDSKLTMHLHRGDVFRHEMSGGGGFGDPMKRDHNLVLQDVIEEKIDIEHAKIDYGVFIFTESNGLLQVDMKSTALLRLKRSAVAKSLCSD